MRTSCGDIITDTTIFFVQILATAAPIDSMLLQVMFIAHYVFAPDHCTTSAIRNMTAEALA